MDVLVQEKGTPLAEPVSYTHLDVYKRQGLMEENKNLVITIGRQYGSGGRMTGEKLAKELGIHFYDEEILKITSEVSAIGEEYFRLADEKAGNNLLYKIVGGLRDSLSAPSTRDDIVSRDNLFRFQSSVIRDLAKERCV